MARFKNNKWNVGGSENPHEPPTWDGAELAVLMDIRDELQNIVALMQLQLNVSRRTDRRVAKHRPLK